MYKSKLPNRYIIIAILVVLLLVFLWGRKSGKGKTRTPLELDREAKNAAREEAERLGIQVDAARVQRHARGLEDAFGWNWGWFNISSWTEDEEAIKEIILLYDAGTYQVLAAAYFSLTGRDLTADIHAYLGNSDINQIRHIISG